MGRRKGERVIGERMYEELIRLFPNQTVAKMTRALGCDRKMPWHWRNGDTPQTIFLQRLHYLGGDVLYVLTGCRSAVVSEIKIHGTHGFATFRWKGSHFEEE